MTTYQNTHQFTIGQRVYQGSMASIYEATWDFNRSRVWYYTIDNIVRLKTITRVRTRILSSVAEETRVFQHPNLPDVIGAVGPTEQYAGYFARMPEGSILQHEIRRRGKLDPAQTLKILRGVSKALRAIRDYGVMPHRGPTVERIWLTNAGEPILLGWGDVFTRNDLQNMSGRTTNDLWWHLPPEVLRDAGDNAPSSKIRSRVGSEGIENLEASESAEVWVLGTLAYYCLTGVHPYYRDEESYTYGVENTIGDIKADYPSDCSFLGPVINIALSHDLEERYQSPEEFVEAFAEVLYPGESLEDNEEPIYKPVTREMPVLASAEADSTSLFELRNSEAERKVAEARAKLWMIGALGLFAAFIFLIVLDLQRPRSILITSEPNGIEIVEVTGHLDTPRGRTPLILTNRKAGDPLILRTIGPSGDMGEPLSLDPDNFDDLGRCVSAQLVPNIVPAGTFAGDDAPMMEEPTAEPTEEP